MNVDRLVGGVGDSLSSNSSGFRCTRRILA